MKVHKGLPELSRAEFDILRILWKRGRLSVREVHDQIVETQAWAYSTTKTMMDRMVKKGLLSRAQFHGVFLYNPLVSRPRGFARFIQFFAERVLELDYDSVVSLFVRSEALTAEEIEELSEILEQEKGGPCKS
ncbi:BlaI/MecI/CopY family transcriptional regulator [bacterium]|nr:BlaI/MecI/CopY family transcriptional regulator [bacterium]